MNNLTRREEINLHEVVQKSFPKILIKNLTEHERICPVCNGLGMRITGEDKLITLASIREEWEKQEIVTTENNEKSSEEEKAGE